MKIGSQAEVDILNPDATTSKYFSNSNTVTSAIPGIALNLQSNTNTPFTVTVAQSTTQLVNAVQNFTSVYNAVISEINAATAPPIVTSVQPGSNGTAQSVGGGILYGNNNIQDVKNQLTQLVSGFLGSGNSLNSLSQIGLSLTDSFYDVHDRQQHDSLTGSSGGSPAGNSQPGAAVQQTTYQGTDGQLQQLDAAAFEKAFASNPNGVFSLLTGSNGLTSQLGAYLTGVTGAPTILNQGVVGTVPAVSLINNYETTNTDAITNLQQQIQQLTDNANAQANNLRAQFTPASPRLPSCKPNSSSSRPRSGSPFRRRRRAHKRMKLTADQRYLETAIATASKEDLIVKIFDVLIIASQQAHEKLLNERNDIEGIHKALLRAQRACCVLMGALDMDIGGELSKNLLRVYEFWHHELVMANMQKDPDRVERILGYAKDYRQTWHQAVAQFKAQRSANQAAEAGVRLPSSDDAVTARAAVEHEVVELEKPLRRTGKELGRRRLECRRQRVALVAPDDARLPKRDGSRRAVPRRSLRPKGQ